MPDGGRFKGQRVALNRDTPYATGTVAKCLTWKGESLGCLGAVCYPCFTTYPPGRTVDAFPCVTPVKHRSPVLVRGQPGAYPA